MNNPNDDDRLKEFLRQHAGAVPPAAPNLEQQIMVAVASSPQPARYRRLWFVPPAIAAALAIAWAGSRLLVPAPLSATELASLEAFMESNWNGVLSSPPTTQTE
jgi:anti-sigma factor RsiW